MTYPRVIHGTVQIKPVRLEQRRSDSYVWLSQGFEPIKSLSIPKRVIFRNPQRHRGERYIMSRRAIEIKNAAIKAIADGIMTFKEAQEYCAKFGIAL